MKSKQQKQEEAKQRARSYTFENSKVYRKALKENNPKEDWAWLRAVWEDEQERLNG